ncbi:hypothetical protein AAG589_20995 [Isoptericola sp. F-RaC21]|uniref:hypothetical protein n=1 Tax=Isoptericola sp. F-RaC21 TaxID=3141452 RepID=UPI00315BC221
MTAGDPTPWVDVVAAFGTPVAAVGIGLSFWLTLRGQRTENDRAESAERSSEASAERSERAAALTIDTLTRIADALDTLAAQGLAGPSAVRPARVEWSLAHHGGDTYILTNTGEATAHHMTLTADESLIRADDWPTDVTLGPGEALTFMALVTMGTRDKTITVKWADAEDADELREWRYPLPPRPPRSKRS